MIPPALIGSCECDCSKGFMRVCLVDPETCEKVDLGDLGGTPIDLGPLLEAINTLNTNVVTMNENIVELKECLCGPCPDEGEGEG